MSKENTSPSGGVEPSGKKKVLESVFDRFRRKKISSGPEKPEPQSYEEMVASAPSIEELLRRRGIDAEEILKNFSEYVERVEYASPSTTIYNNDVPMTGNMHIGLGRVITRREIEKALRK